MSRTLAITLLLFAAIFAVCVFRYAPPPVRGLDTPPADFSAARAREIQRAISGDGASRVIGGDANAKARAFLEAELTKSGWKTEIQSAMSCTRHGACAPVKNVVATRAGKDPAATAVLLMAHYDSVTCSPGATDDGFGISAVVEAARAIAVGSPLRRTVIVVLSDGEEAGLLGADAFARQHPLAATVRGVVNVDSRGSGGPSAMFETSAGNGWIVEVLARHVDRPVTSSLFYEIYRRMPNDTDFTAVKDHAHGLNFANIAKVERYHTSLDSFDNADPRTLQHHGDQALAMVRALANAGPELDSERVIADNAVWFDVLATFIVRWPAAASLGLALTALALVLGWMIRLRAWQSGLRGFAAPFAALVAALLGGVAMGGGLQALGALPVPWIAHPGPALIALNGTCICAGLVVARLVAGKSGAPALWAGTWLTWGLMGVATAILAPGASFLFVVPTLVAGLVAWLRIDIATAIPALAAAVLWLPIVLLVHDGLGLVVPVLACLSSVLLVSTLPALRSFEPEDAAESAKLARRRLAALAGVVLAGAALASVLAPRFSVAIPQRVNVVFRQDNPPSAVAPPARVYVEAAWAYVPWGKPPEGMVRALGEPGNVRVEAPWVWSSPVPMADVRRVDLPAPTAFTLSATTSAAGSSKHVRLTSARGAKTIAILIPPEAALTITVGGQTAIPHRSALVLRAVPAEGIEVVFAHHSPKPVTVTLLDVTPGLPPPETAPVARAVHDARPAEAVQTQEGDITIVTTALDL
jgi:hypothetical protein